VHDSALYAELETGSTALAFAGIEAAEMGGFAVRPNTPTDVPAAYARAVGAGCTPVVAPTDKPWGQTVSYVRDLNGCLVELASPVSQAG